jgi:hypothetical protein
MSDVYKISSSVHAPRTTPMKDFSKQLTGIQQAVLFPAASQIKL